MKRLISAVLAATMACFVLVGPVSAHSDDASARGNVGYIAYGLQRNAQFNVETESNKCAVNVNGTYTFDFEYLGSHYVHDATIANQSKTGNYNISGGYPAGGPHTYAWAGTGNVSGNTVTNSVNYTVGAPGTHMNMTGIIAPNGTMSGTWTDDLGGSRSGSWTTASGAATSLSGCKGEGKFRYSDANGDWYVVNVKYVNINGKDAWFAGQVTKASQAGWVGNWLFAKVHDGGSSGDQIWGSFTSESAAKMGVAMMSDPADGPFAVSSGQLTVKH